MDGDSRGSAEPFAPVLLTEGCCRWHKGSSVIYSLEVYIAYIVLVMATGDALLALLLPGPRHGYDLKRTHDEWFAGMRPLAYGQVYSTLSRLQRDGLVQVAHTETGDGPERVVYELTVPGRERVTGWLADPVDPEAPTPKN